MGSDRYITWGKTPEWGAPTPEKLAATALDFLGTRWTAKILRDGDCIVIECDDYCTFHLASERPEMGDPYESPNGDRARRGFEVYFEKGGGIRVTTRAHSCDSFTDALARRYTEIIAKWWNGEVKWPT